jgi:hypothetical protein
MNIRQAEFAAQTPPTPLSPRSYRLAGRIKVRKTAHRQIRARRNTPGSLRRTIEPTPPFLRWQDFFDGGNLTRDLEGSDAGKDDANNGFEAFHDESPIQVVGNVFAVTVALQAQCQLGRST